MEVQEYLEARREFFNSRLPGYLPAPEDCPPVLLRAVEYSLFAGGKRLRPILLFAAAEGCGGSREKALPLAAALEMVHTYSLIHDDLPAMDDDDFRRGRPSCHKVFGEGMAILAGDALLTQAFLVLAREAGEVGPRAGEELALAAGPVGMVAGQALDISGAGAGNPEALRRLHALKTGALIQAAVRLGAMSAGAGEETLAGLTEFARAYGLAYQIANDIRDVTKTRQELGKSPGSDVKKGKSTYASLFGLEKARALALEEISRGEKALVALAGDFSLLTGLARSLKI